ncbi:MAG: hypothetical protein DSO01_06615 [Archaeoglobi archaeon]|nr:MAG: hypothetical protein DSO01_06615 [Archaeoglobi archaeon]TDA26407.1 MAG: hypothetical protein DSN99_06415 [Archaeoglobi archaeon]
MEECFRWAYATGREILSIKAGQEKGADFLERLIYHIRAEETPGRFLERLSERLTEYRTNKGIRANVNVLPKIMMIREMYGDRFYHAKAAILAGFLNALATPSKEEKKSEV